MKRSNDQPDMSVGCPRRLLIRFFFSLSQVRDMLIISSFHILNKTYGKFKFECQVRDNYRQILFNYATNI